MTAPTKAADEVIVSLEEAWSEIVRECGVRERVYDKWVTDMKLSWADARDRLARCREAATILAVIVSLPAADQETIIDAVAAHKAKHAK